MLNEGSKAPDFALQDDHGNTVRLSDFFGKSNIVLFFYPKADTPG
jgi:peroxiredoxin